MNSSTRPPRQHTKVAIIFSSHGCYIGFTNLLLNFKHTHTRPCLHWRKKGLGSGAKTVRSLYRLKLTGPSVSIVLRVVPPSGNDPLDVGFHAAQSITHHRPWQRASATGQPGNEVSLLFRALRRCPVHCGFDVRPNRKVERHP